MKRKLSIALALAMIPAFNASAISGVNVENGSMDRVFTKDVTLYYVTPDSSEIPIVTADDAQLLQSASDMSGDNMESLTLFKDNETGKLYRFIIDGAFKKFSLNSFGFEAETRKLTTEGVNNTGKKINILVLKPYSDTEIFYDINECSVLDIKDKAVDILENADENFNIEYILPEETAPGDYVIMMGNNKENIVQKSIYYASEDDVLKSLKEFGEMVYDESKLSEFEKLVEKNKKPLNLEIDNYDLLKDKSIVFMNVAGKEYKDSNDFKETFDIAVAVSMVNEAEEDKKVSLCRKYNNLLGLDFDTVYSKLNNPDIGAMMEGEAESVLELKNIWNKAAAAVYINESSASDMKERFDAVYKYLGISEEEYEKYSASGRTDGILKEIYGKDFSSPSALVKAFSDALESEAENKPGTDQDAKNNADKVTGGGGSSNKGGGTVPLYIPAGEKEYEPDEEEPEIENNGFDDIDGVPWAKEAIYYLKDIEVINGKAENKFAPGDYVTREEFVKMIVSAFDFTAGEGTSDFDDVTEDDWYYKYILAGVQNNIIKGKSEQHFGAGEKITRQDIAVILVNAAQAANININTADTYDNVMDFKDNSEMADYAAESIRKLYKCKIVTGVGDNRFAPNEPATRAQAAVFIYRLLMMSE